MSRERCVYVKVLGCFALEYDQKVLTKEQIHSVKMTRLLAYLVVHHDQTISSDVLCELIWPGETGSNPVGALKNLIYRLRKKLEEYYGRRDFIRSCAGAYEWNRAIPIHLDAEEFESLCQQMHYKEALLLYQGEMLQGVTQDYWAVSQGTYYHTFYLDAVKQVVGELVAANRYGVAEQVCMKALEVDGLDEEIHCLALRSMCQQGKWRRARDYHDQVLELYRRELGIYKPRSLECCYEQFYLGRK